MSLSLIEHAASLRIGSVEFVSPDEIKVGLDIEAPDGVAANAGTPRAFPVLMGMYLFQRNQAILWPGGRDRHRALAISKTKRFPGFRSD